MKKLIVFIIAAMIPFFLAAQGTPLSSLYDKYVSEPGFETTEVMPGSMSFDWEKDIDLGQVKEMMASIDKIRILKYKSETDKAAREKIWKKMQKAADDDLYTEVVSVNAEKVRVNMYMIKGTEGTTREVAMLEKDENGIMMITVTGNMDFSAMFSPENMQNLREMGKYFMQNKGTCTSEVH
jgi:hypothetical protein